jgi:hypothetical protein
MLENDLDDLIQRYIEAMSRNSELQIFADSQI